MIRFIWKATLGGILAAVLASAVAAALARKEPECRLPADAAQAIDAAHPADRLHIRHDLMQVEEAARQFEEAVARRPIISDSIDAQAGAKTAPGRARAWCETILMEQVAATHQLSTAALYEEREHLDEPLPSLHPDSVGNPHADAERTSGTVSTSSVVSLPSR